MARNVEQSADHWREIGTMGDGNVEWRHAITAERRICPAEVHPLDQPNFEQGARLSVVAPSDSDELDETPEDRVAALLTDDGIVGDSRAKIVVMRVERNGENTYCAEYSVGDFENGGYEMIRRSFGPGRYMIRFYGQHPMTGKFGLRARPVITIADNKTDPKSLENSAMAQMFQTLATSLEKMQQQIIDIKNTPAKDPRTEFMANLEMMSAMKATFGGDQQKSSIGEIVDAIKELKGASKLVGEKDEPADPLLAVAGPLLQRLMSAPEPVGFPAVAVPPTVAALPSIDPTLVQTQINPMQQAQIIAPADVQPAEYSIEDEEAMLAIQMLKLRARKNADVEETAELIYNNAPEEMFAALQGENWFDLLKLIPEFAQNGFADQYLPWFALVRNAVLKIVAEENQSETPPA